MSQIKLIKVSDEYAEKILEYRAEFPTERMRVTYDPSRIPGMDYLEKYESVFEWLQFCEDMADKITWYMAIRENDGKIVGFIIFRHKYIRQNGSISSQKAADIGGYKSKTGARKLLDKMIEKGLITKIGNGPATKYVI